MKTAVRLLLPAGRTVLSSVAVPPLTVIGAPMLVAPFLNWIWPTAPDGVTVPVSEDAVPAVTGSGVPVEIAVVVLVALDSVVKLAPLGMPTRGVTARFWEKSPTSVKESAPMQAIRIVY